MRPKEDHLWKEVLEEVFEDFIRFLHPGADEIFDFDRGITFLDKELQQLFPPEGNQYAPKLVDKLAKVYTRDGKEEWVLIHVEVQGAFQKNFALRMFTYYYRILDKYQKRISACAILTEPVLRTRSGTYEEKFLGTSIRYQFNVYKIAAQDEEKLRTSENLFAQVVLAAKAKFIGRDVKNAKERDEMLLSFKTRLLRELAARSVPKRKIHVLVNFLTYIVRFENQNNNKIYNKEKQKLIGGSQSMSIEQYMLKDAEEKGRREERDKLTSAHIKKLLTFPALNLSDEIVSEALGVPLHFVQKVKASIERKNKKHQNKNLQEKTNL